MSYYYGYGFDWTWILILIGVVISGLASLKVKSAFATYSKVGSRAGMTGAQAAQRILQSQGIYDVQIQRISGNLSDHYDPRSKVLNLSSSVYGSSSVAAIGVAAHECGHAIQDATGYAPLQLRSAFVPVANFGSTISMPLIIAGVFFGYIQSLINIGIICFSLAVLFQLITLPVEFDASARALRLLGDCGILYDEEVGQTKKVLSAAALTYVAGAMAAILQLVRLLILFGGNRRRD